MQAVSQSDEEAEKLEIMQVRVPLWKWCNVIKQSLLLLLLLFLLSVTKVKLNWG